MGVGDAPKYGTLEHRKLRVGHEALADGEKTRPHYLGTVLDLGGKREPVGIKASAQQTDGARRQSK
jgi:hypothetical protein